MEPFVPRHVDQLFAVQKQQKTLFILFCAATGETQQPSKDPR